jgi:hypothetical protein
MADRKCTGATFNPTLPTGIIVNVGKQRISRKIGFNGKFLQYERT